MHILTLTLTHTTLPWTDTATRHHNDNHADTHSHSQIISNIHTYDHGELHTLTPIVSFTLTLIHTIVKHAYLCSD